MNRQLALILMNRLAALGIFDVVAGLVKTVETSKATDDNTGKVVVRMPVATDFILNPPASQDCPAPPEMEIVPDSSKRGIAYVEDGGTLQGKWDSRGQQYTSSLTVVVWANVQRLVGDGYANISAALMNVVAKVLVNRNQMNIGDFKRLKVVLQSIQPQDKAIFARYSYSEAVTQYLRPPFEFFALKLQITYTILPTCVQPLVNVLPPNTDICDLGDMLITESGEPLTDEGTTPQIIII